MLEISHFLGLKRLPFFQGIGLCGSVLLRAIFSSRTHHRWKASQVGLLSPSDTRHTFVLPAPRALRDFPSIWRFLWFSGWLTQILGRVLTSQQRCRFCKLDRSPVGYEPFSQSAQPRFVTKKATSPHFRRHGRCRWFLMANSLQPFFAGDSEWVSASLASRSSFFVCFCLSVLLYQAASASIDGSI